MVDKHPSINDLFQLSVDRLDQSLHRPNILNYGEKSYPEQERFHKSTKRGRYIAGGNRGGKTDASVVEAIWWAMNSHPFQRRPELWGKGAIELRFVVVDVAKGIEQIMLPKFKRWLPESYLVKGSWEKSWDSQNYILTLSNGSTIDFVTWGMDMMKLGGVPRHAIFFDEEPPQHIFNESMMRLVDYKGFWVIAGTPVNGMTWTYDYLWEPSVNNPGGPIDTFELNMIDNPYVEADEDARDFLFMATTSEDREIREQGHFVARSGLIFPKFNANIELFTKPGDRVDISSMKSWDWYTSTDFGYSNPTAWLWHAVGPQGQIITFAEHYASKMNVGEHAAVVHEREGAWGKVPDTRVGDPNNGDIKIGTTGTSYVGEYAMRDIFIDTTSIPRNVEIGIEKMQQYLTPREDSPWGPGRPMWIISGNCPQFIREMKKLRWATYSSDKQTYELNKHEVVHKKDDHAFDSARYFCTLMPDLTPDTGARSKPDAPITISYQEMLAKYADDPDISYVDDAEEDDEPDWATTFSFGELYTEGADIG